MAGRRIRDRWHNSTPDQHSRDVIGEKSSGDQASALAFILWRHALNGAINLHAEDFRYDSDQQRIGVIGELLAFQIQHVDRLTYAFIDQHARAQLITQLCHKVSAHMQDNLTDIAGPGNYVPPFLELLNARFSDYAGFSYNDDEPGYKTLRYLGRQVLEIMGHDQENRWVIDQIIEIDAPDIAEQVTRSTHRLYGNSAS
ncbi:MAG: hypothetical protein AAF404_01460 [Pseudomonadota bacterium]